MTAFKAHRMTGQPADYGASLQHLGLLADKVTKLNDLRVQAEQQILHRVASDYTNRTISLEDLYEFYLRFRTVALEGFTNRWDEAISVPSLKVRFAAERYLRNRPTPEGTWSGIYPFAGQGLPEDLISVVYVLFDAENVPCYVGSTHRFRKRLQRHRRDGKGFERWMAYRCDDREGAYDLEERLLREHKPYLNRKASR